MSITLQSTYSLVPGAPLLGTVDVGVTEVTTMKNANASASIPFGAPVAYKPSGGTSDIDATTPANSSDLVMGLVMHGDDYARAWTDNNGTTGELDSTGLTVGTAMSVLRMGRMYVTCITGCVPGDRLYVSYAVGGPYTAAGQLGNATQASTTIDCTTKGEWRTTASAAGGAWLDVDFINK